nr:PIN domain-containing protein [uncultured Pedobacter sp.]
MEKILIDTDVILDFFLDRNPFSEDATVLLNLCRDGKIQGFVTPVMISNIYYILRKVAKHDKVLKSIKILLKTICVLEINNSIILRALNSEFKDFEDALQNFSAENHEDISVIITRNTKDFKTSKLSVMTPGTYLKTVLS